MRNKAAQIIGRISKEPEKEVDIDAHIDEQIKWEMEKAEKRQAWEAQKKAEAEQRERQLKQARMEAWLKGRREAWMDHTGALPPADVMASWRAEYVANVAAEQELERELRLAQAEDIAGS
jgi:hypothetical protein